MRSVLESMVTICLLATVFSGCINTPDAAIFIPAPSLGDEFIYLGSDGSRITLSVRGIDEARDASLSMHETVTLDLFISPQKYPDKTIHVEEEVDLAAGLTVRQILSCIYAYRSSEFFCDDARASVYYHPSGLPGALGAGPLWGRTIDSNFLIATNSLYHAIDSLEVKVLSIDADCMTLRYAKPHEDRSMIERGAWVPTTVLFEDATFCDNLPFPVAWTPSTTFAPSLTNELQPTFHLETIQRSGTNPIEMRAESQWSWQGALPLVGPQATFLIPDEGENVEITSAKAYQVAIEKDALFADAVSSGGKVHYNEYQEGGGVFFDRVGVTEEYSVRKLSITTSNGSLYQVTVLKRHLTLNGSFINDSYEIMSREWQDGIPVLDEAYSRPSVDVNAAFDFLGQDGRPDVKISHYGFRTSYLDPVRPTIQSPFRGDGHELRFIAMGEDVEEGAGVAVVVGYSIIIDGPTGVILRIDIPPEHIPEVP